MSELQPPERPSMWSILRWVAGMAVVFGLLIAARRSPAEGLVWTALIIVTAVPATVVRPWVDQHRTIGSAVVDFLRLAPLSIISVSAASLALFADDSVAEAVGNGISAGCVVAAVSAWFDWRDRQQTLARP